MSDATSRDLFGFSAQTVGNARTIDNSGNSWAGGEWWQQLQPASWRGVGFVLDAGETHAGRRVAIHEYPYRDDVWPEDLGKLPRRFSVQGYLVGDDVYQQRDAMIRAAEAPGAGTLVHPTLGAISCVLLEFASADRRERGRYVEIVFSFIQSGDVRYPLASLAAGQGVTYAAAQLNAASRGDLGLALAPIVNVPLAATNAVIGYTGLALRAVNDAGRIIGAVRGLQGCYGRYAAGSRATSLPVEATARSVLAAATMTRSAVIASADLVNLTASLL